MHTVSLPILTGWTVRELPSEGRPVYSILPTIPATVPGHVHLDLLRAGVIGDPFERMNERGVEWIDETDWVYETTFHVEVPLSGKTYLVFDGIDTVADIALNDKVIACVDNMYHAHEIDVTSALTVGDNKLRVTIYSAAAIGRKRMAEWEAAGHPTTTHGSDGWGPRAFVRKAQYMYGWDWGPVLRSAGLWRGVRLVNIPVARITDWRYDVAFAAGDDEATVSFDIAVERASDKPIKLTVDLFDVTAWGEPLETPLPDPVTVTLPAGQTSAKVSLTVPEPRRWWPNGTENATDRAPHLYGLEMLLRVGSDEIDSRSTRIGLRTAELLHEPDADGNGEGFKFRINGADIFVKGANWIPADSFPSRLQNESETAATDTGIEDDRVIEQICMARDAGMNLLRIWGGGLYESDHFYELCDEQGLLVWQDFPHACSYYPDIDRYADAARIEASHAIRRLRVHPALVLWCGNNENQQLHFDKWVKPPMSRFLGEHLYEEIYPKAVADEDPGRAYWPGSPYGGANPGSADFGDRHNWDVWHGRGDWKFYAEDNSRFCSEFGFASSCGLAAWDDVLAPEDRTPYGAAVRWHDKTRKGYDVYLGMVKLHYPDPQSLEELVYFTQINQAEALKFGIEHYRRSKGRCWGTIVWQINDCWPVQSWAMIDSTPEPKASYFAAKSFYAPLLLSLVTDGGKAAVHLVSDLLEPVKGTIHVVAETFDGQVLAKAAYDVEAAANSAAKVAEFDLAAIAGHERDALVYAHFEGIEAPDADNFLFFAEPKEWRLSRAGLSVEITLDGDEFEVAITATKFTPYVWLRLSDDEPLFENGVDDGDNFFHLRAGSTRLVRIAAREGLETVEEVRARLLVTSF
ncbi:MAG: hypothetical protein P4L33_20165 [Capsulimonadaceae bacterium]|nr:hypothetical protein [Capsulimonadaceae bacterium]